MACRSRVPWSDQLRTSLAHFPRRRALRHDFERHRWGTSRGLTTSTAQPLEAGRGAADDDCSTSLFFHFPPFSFGLVQNGKPPAALMSVFLGRLAAKVPPRRGHFRSRRPFHRVHGLQAFPHAMRAVPTAVSGSLRPGEPAPAPKHSLAACIELCCIFFSSL